VMLPCSRKPESSKYLILRAHILKHDMGVLKQKFVPKWCMPTNNPHPHALQSQPSSYTSIANTSLFAGAQYQRHHTNKMGLEALVCSLAISEIINFIISISVVRLLNEYIKFGSHSRSSPDEENICN